MAEPFDFDLDMVSEQFENAAREMTEALGGVSDPTIDLYNKLNSQDFNALLGKYGVRPTLDYIKDVESLRAKQARRT